MTQKGTTMQKIDRRALRSALRSPAFVLSLVVAALYVAASIYVGGPVGTTAIYTVLFLFIAGVWLVLGYRDDQTRARWAARDAADAARHEEQAARWAERFERAEIDQARWLAERDEDDEQRDIERDVERTDHETRLAEIARTGTDPGPSDAMLELLHRRQAQRDAADEDYRIERAARQARIARRQQQDAA